MEVERLRVLEVQRLFLLELERLRVVEAERLRLQSELAEKERLRLVEIDRQRLLEVERLRVLADEAAALEAAERERVRACANDAAGTVSTGSLKSQRSSSCRRIGRITFEGDDKDSSMDGTQTGESTSEKNATRGAEGTTKTPFPYLRRKSFGGHEARKKLSLTPEKVFYPSDKNPGFPFPYMSTSHNVQKK